MTTQASKLVKFVWGIWVLQTGLTGEKQSQCFLCASPKPLCGVLQIRERERGMGGLQESWIRTELEVLY